jgi:hypothetical protein
MKKIFFYLFLSVVVFSSCEKEDEPVRPLDFTWPQGTGDYAPYTIGSTFAYEITTINPAKTDSFRLTVAKDTSIKGSKYYKLVSSKPQIQPTYFVNYSNGNLTEITYNLNYLGLGVIIVDSVLETTLKQNLAINDTWNEGMVVQYPTSPTTSVNLNVTFDHTIVNKNYTKRVLDKDYPLCTAVKQVISTIVPPNFPWPPTVPITSQFDNFYANGAGLVQRNVSDGTVIKLKSFNIVK